MRLQHPLVLLQKSRKCCCSRSLATLSSCTHPLPRSSLCDQCSPPTWTHIKAHFPSPSNTTVAPTLLPPLLRPRLADPQVTFFSFIPHLCLSFSHCSPPPPFRSGEHQRLLGLTPGAPCKATSPVPPANINPPNGAAPLPERPPPRTSCTHRTDTRVCTHPTRLLTGGSRPVLAAHTVNNKLSTGLKCARRLM